MDCTFQTEQGKFNYRVGVIIHSGRKVLMARNPNEERAFYYSVGGRVRFGESMEEAALRELKEETVCFSMRFPASSPSSLTNAFCKSRTAPEPTAAPVENI